MAPFSALKRFAARELAEGRDTIDVIVDLQAKGLTSREAEAVVEELQVDVETEEKKEKL